VPSTGSEPAGGPRRRLPGPRALAGAALPVLLVLLFAGLAARRPALFQDSVENITVDWRFLARNLIAPPETPSGVVVVAIDEKSLTRHGRWPWTRHRIADLVRAVAAARPLAVGVDLFFPEPESPAADADLADALAGIAPAGATALVFETGGGAFAGEVPDLLFDQALTRIENVSVLRPLEASRVLLPAEPIASAAPLGHVNYLPDSNGKLRAEHLYVRYGGEYLPSLSLQVARQARRLPWDRVALIGGIGIDMAQEAIVPADEHGRLFINYYGPAGTFRRVSAADLLAGEVPAEALAGRVVLIGATAIATYDNIVTPYARLMPGVEKNATVVANILRGDYVREAPLAVDLLLVLGAGLAVALLVRRRRAAGAILAVLLLAAAVVAGALAAFVAGWRVALAAPLLLVVTQGAAMVGRHYLAEERAARRTRRMFSSYVTERVVDLLIANPEMARLGGQRRPVTILFSDIRGFTTFSEHHPPEEVVATLNEYLGAMTDVVFRWEGTLDKFIGDAVMVFWGAPLPQDDQAERALRCALHMCGRLDQLNAAWTAAGREPLAVGIGIHSGEVLVGNIGAEGKKMDYTVIGDNVNLASRLESLTKKYHARILITETTLGLVRPLIERNAFGHVSVHALERVAVKGREQGVGVFRFDTEAEGTRAKIEGTLGEGIVHMTEK